MNVRDEYFEWMYNLICSNKNKSYHYLLSQLFETPFQYIHPMDANREADGISLRYEWGRSNGYADSITAGTIDICPCSVLEMIVALALRCETTIMADSDKGDRTAKWIWIMLRNLGLESFYDENYHDEAVIFILEKFMSRDYNSDGSDGGLFILQNPREDLRETEIWYQAMWYLSERIERS